MCCCPWDFLGKNTGVGSHFLFQEIFATQGSNPHLLYWKADSLPLCNLGSPVYLYSYTFSSRTQSCPILCNPMDCSTPGFPAPHQLQELAQTHSIELVMPSNHFILCHPLLPPSIFVSIRVFSNESALHIRWPKYWSFNFSISPFNSGLISFRID